MTEQENLNQYFTAQPESKPATKKMNSDLTSRIIQLTGKKFYISLLIKLHLDTNENKLWIKSISPPK